MHCDSTFTSGACDDSFHGGKFSSCLDEVLYQMALDSGDGCGDGDWWGYATPVTVESDEDAPLNPFDSSDSPVVRVPAGWYMVWTGSEGGVTVSKYDSAEELAAKYEEWQTAFHSWLGED